MELTIMTPAPTVPLLDGGEPCEHWTLTGVSSDLTLVENDILSGTTKLSDLSSPEHFGRTKSGFDLPSFESLMTPLPPAFDRPPPSLFVPSPSPLDHYINKAYLSAVKEEQLVPLSWMDTGYVPAYLPNMSHYTSKPVNLDNAVTSFQPSGTDASARKTCFSSIRMGTEAVQASELMAKDEALCGSKSENTLYGQNDELAKSSDSEGFVETEGSNSGQQAFYCHRTRKLGAAASAQPSCTAIQWKKGKKSKTSGRPIMYMGDPNAVGLTEKERRQIKRRIANRESARRLRQKRNDLLEELQSNAEEMQQKNYELLVRCGSVERQKALVVGQLEEMQQKCAEALSESFRLHSDIASMRQAFALFSSVRSCKRIGGISELSQGSGQ